MCVCFEVSGPSRPGSSVARSARSRHASRTNFRRTPRLMTTFPPLGWQDTALRHLDLFRPASAEVVVGAEPESAIQDPRWRFWVARMGGPELILDMWLALLQHKSSLPYPCDQKARHRCFRRKQSEEHIHVRGALHRRERMPVNNFWSEGRCGRSPGLKSLARREEARYDTSGHDIPTFLELRKFRQN